METLYIRVPKDYCTKQVGLQCGAPEASHPMNMSGYFHEYQGGAMKYVKATQEQIDAASTAQIMAPQAGDF